MLNTPEYAKKKKGGGGGRVGREREQKPVLTLRLSNKAGLI